LNAQNLEKIKILNVSRKFQNPERQKSRMTQNLEKLKISNDSKSRMTQNREKLVKGVLNGSGRVTLGDSEARLWIEKMSLIFFPKSFLLKLW
jgi:hypothetical protein